MEKIVLIFYIRCVKLEESQSHHFLIHSWPLFFNSNATNFFIHSSNRFILKKNAYGLLVFFNRVPYMQLSHMITGVNIIGRKVSVASINGAGVSGGVLGPQQGS